MNPQRFAELMEMLSHPLPPVQLERVRQALYFVVVETNVPGADALERYVAELRAQAKEGGDS